MNLLHYVPKEFHKYADIMRITVSTYKRHKDIKIVFTKKLPMFDMECLYEYLQEHYFMYGILSSNMRKRTMTISVIY